MQTLTRSNIKVVRAPDEKLRTKTKPVKKITPELLNLAKEMIKLTKSFKDPEGVGLASTQIGRQERLFIAKIGQKFGIFFNPQILSKSVSTKVYFEGCLSIPNYWGEVKRHLKINVCYQDESGKQVKKKLQGISAWIFQHEMDHLEGKLFVDQVLTQRGKFFKVAGKDATGAEVFEEIRLV